MFRRHGFRSENSEPKRPSVVDSGDSGPSSSDCESFVDAAIPRRSISVRELSVTKPIVCVLSVTGPAVCVDSVCAWSFDTGDVG